MEFHRFKKLTTNEMDKDTLDIFMVDCAREKHPYLIHDDEHNHVVAMSLKQYRDMIQHIYSLERDVAKWLYWVNKKELKQAGEKVNGK